jgi:hypothetical protein
VRATGRRRRAAGRPPTAGPLQSVVALAAAGEAGDGGVVGGDVAVEARRRGAAGDAPRDLPPEPGAVGPVRLPRGQQVPRGRARAGPPEHLERRRGGGGGQVGMEGEQEEAVEKSVPRFLVSLVHCWGVQGVSPRCRKPAFSIFDKEAGTWV